MNLIIAIHNNTNIDCREYNVGQLHFSHRSDGLDISECDVSFVTRLQDDYKKRARADPTDWILGTALLFFVTRLQDDNKKKSTHRTDGLDFLGLRCFFL